MTSEQAMQAESCDHFYAWVSPAGTSGSVRLCQLCHAPDPDWLNEIEAARVEDAARLAEVERLLTEYESAITWDTTCLNCSSLMHKNIAEYVRAEKAEERLAAVQEIADRGITGWDLTPTVSGNEDVTWWYDYLRALDNIWRTRVTAALGVTAPTASGYDFDKVRREAHERYEQEMDAAPTASEAGDAAVDALVTDLVKAVAFYGEPENYHALFILPDRPAGAFADDFSEDHGHPDYDRPMPGAKAREVLRRHYDALLPFVDRHESHPAPAEASEVEGSDG